MSESIPIVFPEDGLNEAEAFSSQPENTTNEARNVRLRNRKNSRRCGAKRAGSKLWLAGTANGANKISRIESVIYARKKMTYAALADGSHAILAQTQTPSISDCLGVCVDSQSNVFVLDGAAGIVKFNSEFNQVFKLAVPTADPLHICRALWLDEFGGLYVGVSTGGDFDKAKLWKFRQDDENKTSKLWEIETHAYVERIVRVDALLYTIQNDPSRQKTYIVVYSRVDGSAPEEEWRTEVSYPGNDLTVSPTDGSVYWSSEPTSTRGLDPLSPTTTIHRTDWTPKQLYKFSQRVWSWYDASQFDSLLINYPIGQDDPNGLEVLQWLDISGKGRHLYANAKAATGIAGTADTGPSYRKYGIGGMPSLHFSGVATHASSGQSMYTVAPASADRADREYHRGLFPCYAGAQFAMFIVIRAPVELVMRTLVETEKTTGTRARGLVMNYASGDVATGGLEMYGAVDLLEDAGAASDAASCSPAAGGPSGLNGGSGTAKPCNGPRGPYGHAIITWICDGGSHDVFGTATRSQFRVNGQPLDRWQSEKWTSTNPITVGLGEALRSDIRRFNGEIAEILVLADWENELGARQRLLFGGTTSPPSTQMTTFPDTNQTGTAAGPDGECERIEGYLAHKWGLSHLLPGPVSGQVWATGNPGAGNTVAVGGVTYTFRAAGTLAAANDVLIGTEQKLSMANLAAAINNTGTPGVDYYYSTVANPNYYSSCTYELSATTDMAIRVTARNPYAAGSALTKAGANLNVSVATTTYRENGAGANVGNHPHAYFLSKTSGAGSDGVGAGPPSDQLTPGNSKFADLISPYGILGKLDAGGKLRWIATSNRQNNGFGLGGVGWGCVCNSAGEIYTIGPRQALVVTPAILADAFDYRKIVDQGDSYAYTGAGTALTSPWYAAGVENLYHYPRLAVDKFDNVLIPINDTAGAGAGTLGMRVYQRQPNGGGTGLGVQIASVTNITDDCQGYAVVADPRVPEYETDLSDTSNPIQARAQVAFLATRKETATNFNVVHRIGLVSSTPASGSPRARVDLVASGTALRSFTAGGAFVAISTPFDAAADFIDSITLFEKAVFTDGANLFIYDPKKNTVTRLKAKGPGQVPQGCQLISDFNGRVMLARDKSNPHRWYASEQGNLQGWDFDPPTPTATSAVAHTDPRVGPVPDIINAMCKVSEDSFMFGCQKSIWLLLGDPAAQNARLQVVSGSDCGMAFGRSTARDGEGNLFFVGGRGGFYAWEGGPKCLSDETIPRRMRDLDLGSNWVELVWEPRENAMKVYLCPFGAGGTQRLAYTWERRTGKIIPWEDSYGTASDFSRQPTCAKLIEGDTAAERVLLYGTEDGHVLAYDESKNSDDTVPIDAFVTMRMTPKAPGRRFMFRRLKVALAQDDGGCNFELFGSSIAEQLGPVHMMGTLRPGPNPTKLIRIRGRHVSLRLRNAALDQGFAFEEGSIDAELVSKDRAAR